MAENYEEPAYELIQKYRGFEVRKYADTIQARVSTDGMNCGESARPFRRIAGYIFGGNERQQSIAMTTPVHMWESGNESLMAFTMPSEHKIEDLPKPTDSGVELLHVDGEVVAVLKFSGLSRPSKSLRLQKKLRKLVEAEGLTPTSEAKLAVYDNPMSTLPFMRRNEIHLPITWND
ncbi:MAG: heme-binding protein [Euryarchaeota archaeon]|nr:heme-binding protein [Euryarchaeota archaeon]